MRRCPLVRVPEVRCCRVPFAPLARTFCVRPPTNSIGRRGTVGDILTQGASVRTWQARLHSHLDSPHLVSLVGELYSLPKVSIT